MGEVNTNGRVLSMLLCPVTSSRSCSWFGVVCFERIELGSASEEDTHSFQVYIQLSSSILTALDFETGRKLLSAHVLFRMSSSGESIVLWELSTWPSWLYILFPSVILAGLELLTVIITFLFQSSSRIPIKVL